MRVIVVGAGAVGYNIAERLSLEHQDVVVIEPEEGARAHVDDNLDVQTVEGRGSSPSTLFRAGIDQASMIIAVTDSDEVNIVACMVATACGREGLLRVARVRDDDFFTNPRLADRIGRFVDLHINPERVAAEEVNRIISVPAATAVASFADGRVNVVGVPVNDDSPLAGRCLDDLGAEDAAHRFLVVAISRPGEVVIPRGKDQVRAGDTLYAVTEPEGMQDVLSRVGHAPQPLRRVIVAGSTTVAKRICTELIEWGVQTKIIEPSRRRSYALAADMPKAVVLEGSATDRDLLMEEFIADTCAFVAATDDEEENILSAVLAKRLGAKRTIALTDKASYLDLIKTIGVDVVVSPRLAAVSSILLHVRQGRVLSVKALGDEAEVLEFEATSGSAVVKHPLREAGFPPGSIVGAIVRQDEVIIPGGEDRVEPGDRVIVFGLEPAVPAIEKLFRSGI